jgi:serine/threonine protein kinase
MKRHRTADLEPVSFGGRYTLIRRLAIGGMAEIYLARQAAMAGFEKEIVIKRLRAELADDPRVVEMFLDEAKIGAVLNHPNIVHVYDVDEHDGIPYIAMEYIIGEELNELCRRGIAHGRFLPLEHAVELMRQAAAGMGYFHAKRGSEDALHVGEPLDIVHLDVSPSNLLVTQDGFLKIIDFGIARAKGQVQRTDVLPGKLSYMSPEQAARNKDVDHRSDVFSLGIVLYEITVGKRLFRGGAQEVVERLIAAQVDPPTFARRSYPAALESIVMRALEKHPDDRYQSAYDLADDLESFLRDEKLHSGPVRIARYLDMLTIAGGGARRPELISEAEARQSGDDQLDFDSQMFDSFAPAEGAPGPDQAAQWEDADQPEAEVAAALGMELAELRALRTPVPMRPAGMAEVSHRPESEHEHEPEQEHEPDSEHEHEHEVSTNPVPRMVTEELEAEQGEEAEAPNPAGPAPRPPPPKLEPMPSRPPAPAAAAASARPTFGAAFLARTTPPRLVWVLVGALGVAVVALLAYILSK